SHSPVAAPDDPSYVQRVLAVRGYEPVVPNTKEVAESRTYECAVSQYANTVTVLKHLRRFRPDVVYVWFLFGLRGFALLDLLEQSAVPWVMHLMDCVPAKQLEGVVPSVATLFARENQSVFTGARMIAMSRHIISEIAERTGIRFDIPPEIVPGWVDAGRLR